jgi:hypothetical protein
MAINYATSLKNTRLDALTTALGASAFLEILDASSPQVVLARIPLANPAAPGAAGGVLTFTMPQSDTAADATGTAAEARIVDSSSPELVIASGLTVGTSGTDIVVDNTSLVAGQQVTINSFTITHAA